LSKFPEDINRTDEILRFVRDNPRRTKAEVIRHMKGKSAVTTTHALLTSLIDEGKIKVDKINVQTHLLSINEHNEFNKFHKLLSEIEVLIYEMEQGLPDGLQYDPDGVPMVDKGKGTVILDEDDNQYLKLGTALDGINNSYRQAFFMMIQILYNEIYNKFINYDKERRILLHKLDYLNRWLAENPWCRKFANQILEVSAKNIEKYLKDYNRYKFTKDKTDLGDKLIEMIDKVKNQFLN